MNKIPVAILAGASLALSSCYVPYGTYGAYGTYGTTVNSSVAWSAASYDANGYPIYGYSYGQPVYGYTDAGVAITTIAALTALCFIPDWGPASWYRGPAYHPHGHRHSSPPHHPSGHSPSKRPAANHPSNHGPSGNNHASHNVNRTASHGGMSHGGMSHGGMHGGMSHGHR